MNCVKYIFLFMMSNNYIHMYIFVISKHGGGPNQETMCIYFKPKS